MSGLSMRFVLSTCGIILIVFAALYGVHKMTGSSYDERTDSEEIDPLAVRKSGDRSPSRRNVRPSSLPVRDPIGIQARNDEEKIILNAVSKAKEEVAEQQRLRREKMAPLMEKRREFFASLEQVEDEQEKNRLRSEWIENQREERLALLQNQQSTTPQSTQLLASMETKLNSLRRYDLVPQLKPKSDELRALMAQYAREQEAANPESNRALWGKIQQGMQELRRQHQQLMHPERFR